MSGARHRATDRRPDVRIEGTGATPPTGSAGLPPRRKARDAKGKVLGRFRSAKQALAAVITL